MTLPNYPAYLQLEENARIAVTQLSFTHDIIEDAPNGGYRHFAKFESGMIEWSTTTHRKMRHARGPLSLRRENNTYIYTADWDGPVLVVEEIILPDDARFRELLVQKIDQTMASDSEFNHMVTLLRDKAS